MVILETSNTEAGINPLSDYRPRSWTTVVGVTGDVLWFLSTLRPANLLSTFAT
jgi:hypothetical protein